MLVLRDIGWGVGRVEASSARSMMGQGRPQNQVANSICSMLNVTKPAHRANVGISTVPPEFFRGLMIEIVHANEAV